MQNNDDGGVIIPRYTGPGLVTVSGSTVTTMSNAFAGSTIFDSDGSLSNYKAGDTTLPTVVDSKAKAAAVSVEPWDVTLLTRWSQ